jgi:hypothetical protein
MSSGIYHGIIDFIVAHYRRPSSGRGAWCRQRCGAWRRLFCVAFWRCAGNTGMLSIRVLQATPGIDAAIIRLTAGNGAHCSPHSNISPPFLPVYHHHSTETGPCLALPCIGRLGQPSAVIVASHCPASPGAHLPAYRFMARPDSCPHERPWTCC